MMFPDFRFTTAPLVVFQNNVLNTSFADLVGRLFRDNVLLVTDSGLRRLGLVDAAVASLEAAGLRVTIFDAVEADPSREILVQAVRTGAETNCSAVLGFGGGSSLDVAKLCALLLGSGEDIETIWGVGNAKGPRLPLVLVPTTAGTGSEVTPVAIITVDGHEKKGVSTPLILPDMAVLDPSVTLSLPSHITAATGIDAIVHAIEAFASANPNNNPVSKALAREALRLLGANVRRAVRHGEDIEARSGMLLGSLLAGQAFANSPVAAVHALAYPIGGMFGVPHGVSNSLVLPHVLRFNAPTAAEVYSQISADVFPELTSARSGKERCAAFIDALSALSGELGLPLRLRDVGVPLETLPQMSVEAMKQQRLLVNNPRRLATSDVLVIYRAAW